CQGWTGSNRLARLQRGDYEINPACGVFVADHGRDQDLAGAAGARGLWPRRSSSCPIRFRTARKLGPDPLGGLGDYRLANRGPVERFRPSYVFGGGGAG